MNGKTFVDTNVLIYAHDGHRVRGWTGQSPMGGCDNLADALKLVLQCQRELAEKGLSPHAVREVIEIAEA
jgi:hypothetical protein